MVKGGSKSMLETWTPDNHGVDHIPLMHAYASFVILSLRAVKDEVLPFPEIRLDD